jgi:hypothetical protein
VPAPNTSTVTMPSVDSPTARSVCRDSQATEPAATWSASATTVSGTSHSTGLR